MALNRLIMEQRILEASLSNCHQGSAMGQDAKVLYILKHQLQFE